MKKDTMQIQGMTCASCAKSIENSLKKKDGITYANVNLATEKLNIEYDNKKITIEEIVKSIEKLGFKVVEQKINKKEEMNKLFNRFKFSAIFAVPLLIISMLPMLLKMLNIPIPNYIDPMNYPVGNGIVQLLLTIPVVIIGKNYYIKGYKNLIHLSANMDSLIAISTTASFIYGIYNLYQTILTNNNHELYFESVVVILTLITLGKYFEAKAKYKTSSAIQKLIELSPKTAIIIKDGKEVEVFTQDIKIDDIVIIKPGQTIPVDGKVIYGTTYIDESMLTGEPIAIKKEINDKVSAGTINKNGTIKFKVEKIGKDTTLSQIIYLVEQAQDSKLPIARLADKISGYFVPTVLILALIAFFYWIFTGAGIEFSIKIFASVLVIACPCALGLATPTAIMVSTGKAAENGILIRNGEVLETLHNLNVIVFDKTGTITKGVPKLTDVILLNNNINENKLIQYVASIEKLSEHPLAEAIVDYSKQKNIDLLEVNNFKSITGSGIEGIVEENKVIIGNKNFINIDEINNPLVDNLLNTGKSVIYIKVNDILSGVIAITDQIKENSNIAIKKLNELNIKTVMITGDNLKAANNIANQVGIKEVIAEVMPEDKLENIKKIQSKGNIVVMVGDGINDAPALAIADIGIAIGSGTDIAIESADIILMKNDLLDVVTSIILSKKTIINIKENLFWAFGYNILGIPFAMGVLHLFGGPLLSPMIAALAMSLSSISVLLNALRLKRFKVKY